MAMHLDTPFRDEVETELAEQRGKIGLEGDALKSTGGSVPSGNDGHGDGASGEEREHADADAHAAEHVEKKCEDIPDGKTETMQDDDAMSVASASTAVSSGTGASFALQGVNSCEDMLAHRQDRQMLQHLEDMMNKGMSLQPRLRTSDTESVAITSDIAVLDMHAQQKSESDNNVLRCIKCCSTDVDPFQGKVTSKTKAEMTDCKFVCRCCNNVSTMVTRHVGRLNNIPELAELSAAEMKDFWLKAGRPQMGGRLSWTHVKRCLEESLTISVTRRECAKIDGTFLPLDVWAAKGFNIVDIKAGGVYQRHPILGDTYAANIVSINKESFRDRCRSAVLKAEQSLAKKKGGAEVSPARGGALKRKGCATELENIVSSDDEEPQPKRLQATPPPTGSAAEIQKQLKASLLAAKQEQKAAEKAAAQEKKTAETAARKEAAAEKKEAARVANKIKGLAQKTCLAVEPCLTSYSKYTPCPHIAEVHHDELRSSADTMMTWQKLSKEALRLAEKGKAVQVEGLDWSVEDVQRVTKNFKESRHIYEVFCK